MFRRPKLYISVPFILWLRHCQFVFSSAISAGTPEQLIASGGEFVRSFHANGDVGSHGRSHQDIAPLYLIEARKDLDKLQALSYQVTLLVPEFLLTKISPALHQKIAGIFIIPTHGNTSFDSKTPQGRGTIDQNLNPFWQSQHQYNPTGTNILEQAFPFSVVLLSSATVGQKFLEKARQNRDRETSNSYPEYRAFMNYYFGPSKMNSVECLEFEDINGKQAPHCDPIGGQSVWGYRHTKHGDLRETMRNSNGEWIMVMAGMDAKSLSQVLAPGANTAVSGIVALLAAAHALQTVSDDELIRPIVFGAFQSEKYGFVGSRRFLSDIQKFQTAARKNGTNMYAACKAPAFNSHSILGEDICTDPIHFNMNFAHLNLSKLAYAIAIDQVGVLPSDRKQFFVHENPRLAEPSDVKSRSLLDIIKDCPASQPSIVAKSSVNNSLPPTSLLSFLNEKEYGQAGLKSAVFAGYDEEFVNGTLYNTHHDVLSAVDPNAVATAAEIIAQSLFVLATMNGSETTVNSTRLKAIKVDLVLVRDLLDCIATDWSCDLIAQTSEPFVSTMIEYLDLTATAEPSYQQPVTLQTGSIDINRQSLLMTSNGQDYLTSLGQGLWNNKTYRTRIFPNAYEVFIRSFLASTLSPTNRSENAATDKKHCSRTQACQDPAKECVYPGRCRRRVAFFHDAMSPGLARTETLGLYSIIDKNNPIWTEPHWDLDIGSYVFPDPGPWIGWVAMGCGLSITTLSGFLSMRMLQRLKKSKLL
ncbi:hypothetical protein ABG067_004192 [Albugo candida]